jgi:peptidoglycan hydrolase-like protein with peptidoglycan-binding domain
MAEKKGFYPTICMGTKGDLVVQMQELLAKAGSNVRPSGHFNIGTRTALLKFQNEKGLEIDGVCGPETWAELLKYAHIKIVEPGKVIKKPAVPELTLEQKVNILWEEHLKKEGK